MDSNHKNITGNAENIPRERLSLNENPPQNIAQETHGNTPESSASQEPNKPNQQLHQSARLRSVIQNRKKQQLAAQLQKHTHLDSYNDVNATRH